MPTQGYATRRQQAPEVLASIDVGGQSSCKLSPTTATAAPVAVATLHQAVAQRVVSVLGSATLLEVSETALAIWARQEAKMAVASPLLVVDATASDGGMLRSMREALPSIQIILIFDDLENEQLGQMLNCSARGCVDRQTSAADLMRAMLAVRAGQLWVPRSWLTGLYELAAAAWVPRALGKLVTEQCGGGIQSEPSLTHREMGAIELAHQGLTNKEIARLLHISGSTVKKHLAHAYEKLGIRHRRQLYSAR